MDVASGEEKLSLKGKKNKWEKKKIFGSVVGGLEKRKEISLKGITSAFPVVQQAVHKKHLCVCVCVFVGLFVRAFMKECVCVSIKAHVCVSIIACPAPAGNYLLQQCPNIAAGCRGEAERGAETGTSPSSALWPFLLGVQSRCSQGD